jgi:hypothetical protein
MVGILKVIGWVVGSLFVLLVGLVVIWLILLTRPMRQLEAHLAEPATWEPACAPLAKMCQSDHALFGPTTQFDTIIGHGQRVPPEVVGLQPEFLSWRPNGIDVFFGGGMGGFEYDLSLDQATSTDAVNQWKLTLNNDTGPMQVLKVFSLPTSAHYTADDLTGWRPIPGKQWQP